MQNNWRQSESLKSLCTFGVGGHARYYVEVHTVEKMSEVLAWCQKQQISHFILGKGSNCLFDDTGFDGLVVHNKISFCRELTSGLFHVGAGYSFSYLGVQTARGGWQGLEFASGIPASVGGAVFMNAGANGGETADYLVSVDFVHSDGRMATYTKEELIFAYRTSSFQNIPGAIVGATFQLTTSVQARQKQLDILSYRKRTQPQGVKSAGCVFRNPPSGSAGQLIEKYGLKGLSIGGASVSTVHANFIINSGDATAADILALLKHIKECVKDQSGIELESELRIVAAGCKSNGRS